MEMKCRLLADGFDWVIALDAAECGAASCGTVLLALWFYEAEADCITGEAWIHPYYYASQQAYRAAEKAARESEGQWQLRDDIRLKPIFARLPGFSQGRNTLSYVKNVGSRFHVQTLLTGQRLPVDVHLAHEAQPLQCGTCQRCMEACPTGAIDALGYHREKCLRNWMMSGKPIPENMRQMGNRLLGCDDCQRCCPHNPVPKGKSYPPIPLKALLESCKEETETLRPIIGSNMAIPNRVLSQACLVAGCSGRMELAESLTRLCSHPSLAVAEHAAWALKKMKK